MMDDESGGPSVSGVDVPLLGRHFRGAFGPVELDLWGAAAVCDLEVGAARPLTLTWTDDPPAGSRGGPPVGMRLATLLRTSGMVELDRPDLVRIPGRRKVTDPPSTRAEPPAVARTVRAVAVPAGIRLEIGTAADHSGGVVTVVIPADDARRLADLLDAWSAYRAPIRG